MRNFHNFSQYAGAICQGGSSEDPVPPAGPVAEVRVLDPVLAGELLLLEEVAPPLLLPQAPPPAAQNLGHHRGRQVGELLVDLLPLLLGEYQEGVHRPLDVHFGLGWRGGRRVWREEGVGEGE